MNDASEFHPRATYSLLLIVEARIFSKALMRLASLNSLSQAVRGVLQSSDITSQMLSDWSRIDLNGICKQILYTVDKYTERDYNMIVTRKLLLLSIAYKMR